MGGPIKLVTCKKAKRMWWKVCRYGTHGGAVTVEKKKEDRVRENDYRS